MTKQLCMHCYISGKVQGVWFRASAKKQAQILGVTGWARNLTDGRVEVIACGDEQQLKQFDEWLREGPPLAHVNDYVCEDLDWKQYDSFDIM